MAEGRWRMTDAATQIADDRPQPRLRHRYRHRNRQSPIAITNPNPHSKSQIVVSILDIIGPVMVGPSSSHTAGACRLGLLARNLVGGTPDKALIELHGSFARTGEGHGTDKAIVAGLMGFR